MKKIYLLVLVFSASVLSSYAGGLLTNTNQSAQFVRMMSRNATTEVDAVYFNPAGLTAMRNGWHFSLNNQTVSQTRIIDNDFPLLNESHFEGDVTVPLFPSGFAVYKKNNSAFSVGFGINSGGGAAEFNDGLPLTEFMVMQNAPAGVGYDENTHLEGMSAFWGIQANYSYKFNDIISGAVGMRVLIAKNTYEGQITDIAFGGTPIGQDMNLDTKQTDVGFTPILSLNIKPADKWNLAVKYEFRTKLALDASTKVDDTGKFPDGATVRNDVPAILSAGVEYKPIDDLKLAFSMTNYFDRGVNWGNDIATGAPREIDNNTIDWAFGAEYGITEKTRISAGYQYTSCGVAENYYTDLNYSLSSSTVGAGAQFDLSTRIKLDLGFLYTFYTPADKFVDMGNGMQYTETYDRENFAFAVGLSYSIFK